MRKKLPTNLGTTPHHVAPKATWLLKQGEKYYRRLQPVPWAYKKIDIKKWILLNLP